MNHIEYRHLAKRLAQVPADPDKIYSTSAEIEEYYNLSAIVDAILRKDAGTSNPVPGNLDSFSRETLTYALAIHLRLDPVLQDQYQGEPGIYD